MGEIRIKSGNLANGELEQGSLNFNDGSEVVNNTRVRTVGNTLLKEGTYTINCAGATGGVVVCAYNTDDLSYDKAASYVGQWRSLPFTFVVDNERLYRFAFKKANNSVIVPSEITDIQLLEGTYTSETIPEYQPYFLNRPAHQYVNGEWIDIPTHHFISGRWQGELTSQSPLKFRADGAMLDWRIEGASGGVGDFDEAEQRYRIPVTVKGKNLFDVKHFVDTAYCHNVVLTQLDNGMKIQATSSSDPYVNYANGVIGQTLPINMRSAVIPCKPNTNYTLHCVQSSRIGKYLSYFDKDYKVVKKYTPFSGTPLKFKTPETCVFILLRLGDTSTLSEGTTIELTNIQLLEGTYTASTLPPYEVNLYTDHQLMDGDSIDFSTDQTQIPIATGNNTLTVNTAVKPKSVFIKFEG